MSEYEPETANVRSQYASARVDHSYAGVATMASGSAEFDRWLAAHDADVRKAALTEARGAILDGAPPLNSELRHDGTEDKIGAAYVEAFHDALSAVDELIRAAALGDAPTGGQ